MQTLVTLAAVVALALLVLFGARRLGVGRPSGPLTLLGRLPLEGRRVVYLVKAGERAFLIAAGESAIAPVGELPISELAGEPSTPRPRFGELLGERARLRRWGSVLTPGADASVTTVADGESNVAKATSEPSTSGLGRHSRGQGEGES